MTSLWADFGGDTIGACTKRGPVFSVTRTTPGYRTNADGSIEDVGSGVARTNHYAAGVARGGLLVEEARTFSGLWGRDLTNAAWVKSASMAAAKDATGVDGTVNAASTLTTSAATQTCLQTVTKTSASHAFGPYIKRKTGTGTVEITVNGGTNWQDVTSSLSTTAWYRASEVRTVANPQFGFRIATSGDEIEVDFASFETGPQVTSPMLTEGAAVTRNADSIGTTDASWISDTNGSLYVSASVIANDPLQYFFTLNDGASNVSNSHLLFLDNDDRAQYQCLDGNVIQCQIIGAVKSAATLIEAMISYGVNDFAAAADGVSMGTDTSGTLPSSLARLQLGNRHYDLARPLNGTIYEVGYIPKTLPVGNLTAIT